MPLYQVVLKTHPADSGLTVTLAAPSLPLATDRADALAKAFRDLPSAVWVAKVEPYYYEFWPQHCQQQAREDAETGSLSVELRHEPEYGRVYYWRRIQVVGREGLTPEECCCCLPF